MDIGGKRDIDRAVLQRMNETQHHRGPDEADLYLEPGIGFGHRRLSVIDIAAGLQPLGNEDGSVMVCFNGEIYNFRELTVELKGLGHVFRTRCDTEVIVHAWEEWGEACVHRFRGMFAFGLWDRKQQTMFIGRDRLGVKPLYYCLTADGFLAFSSELKALASLPDLERRIDPRAVEDYFAYGYIPEPRTIYQGALKLAPGHTLTQKVGAPLATPVKFWDVPFAPHAPMASADVEHELIERLREAVRIRLVADVPLGAFLWR
jgi:asparagine synthase (glutamine-hydrolysing)